MTSLSTNYSLSTMLETPIQDFKTQLSSLNPKQIDNVVKGWMEECNNIKPGAYDPSELYKRAICVLPENSQQHFPALAEAIYDIEDSKPLISLEEAWEQIHNNFEFEAPFWHRRYDSFITDSIPEAESKLQEELNILAALVHDSRDPEGRERMKWPKILEDQKGELRPLLKEELLDVCSSRNRDIYEDMLAYGSIEDIEQLLTFVREKRGDEALRTFAHGRNRTALWFISRGCFLKGDELVQRAKQLVTLYHKLGLDPKTFIFNPDDQYEDSLSRATNPKLLKYLLMQLSEKERVEACKLRGNRLLWYAREGHPIRSQKLMETIHAITGLNREDLINDPNRW